MSHTIVRPVHRSRPLNPRDPTRVRGPASLRPERQATRGVRSDAEQRGARPAIADAEPSSRVPFGVGDAMSGRASCRVDDERD